MNQKEHLNDTWKIHGKTYDLTNYLEKHPGGKDILLKTKGQGDISALFETYHAFSDLTKIEKYLAIYEVTNDPIKLNSTDRANEKETPEFDFTSYRKLAQEIRLLFPTRESIKAPVTWICAILGMVFLYLTTFYYGLFSGPQTLLQLSPFPSIINPQAQIIAIRLGCITLSSFCSVGIIFNGMHDASHYGISSNPLLNQWIAKIISAWNGFNANMWSVHHVFHHHSFTGLENRDPDLYYYYPFGIKTPSDKTVPDLIKKIQPYTLPFLLFIFPGQIAGQIIAYFIASFRRILFGIPLPPSRIIPRFYDEWDLCILIISFLVCYRVVFLGNGGWFLLCGWMTHFIYSINVIFDHDLYETRVENKYRGNDWLKIQISHSGNFCHSYPLWTFWFGAINHQIEHHLFPGMSSAHYPTIAPLIQSYCQREGIPYAHAPDFVSGFKSFLKGLKWNSLNA